MIGVVGPEIRQRVPDHNRTWKTETNGLKAEVAFLKPLTAIRQAYYECKLNQECDDTTDVIVLAQMPPSSAEELTDSLTKSNEVKHLRMTIAQAEIASTLFGENMDFASAGRRVPVIATRSIYTPDRDCTGAPADNIAVLDSPLHLIHLTEKGYVTHRRRPVLDLSKPYPVPKPEWCQELRLDAPQRSPLDIRVAALGNRIGADKNVEQFAVEVMRAHYHADAALITKHQVFRDPAAAHASIEEQTARVIWEGAHIMVLQISGKKLREALKAQANAPADHKLVMSGIVPSDDGNFYINSRPLNDGSYYDVVASDALVLGDAIYAALADDTFKKPSAENDTIATLVCRDLGGGADCLDASLDIGSIAIKPSFPRATRLLAYFGSVLTPHHHDPIASL
ncbi:MAG: hypothetical protein DMG65_18750, partial [Candidatus Angelobacter sp. Gp1-AA117]